MWPQRAASGLNGCANGHCFSVATAFAVVVVHLLSPAVATLGVPVAAPKFPRFSPNGPPWPSRPSSLKTLPSQSLPAG